uniref:Uncharacterized protein n=1 Tax=Arundo donax TaxID=35708 RepID=A0A0A9A8U7_ARUDO
MQCRVLLTIGLPLPPSGPF